MAIHDFAARGFERGAQDYEKGRPSYPAGVIETLQEQCGLGPDCDVVDVGAGTGKFTRQLEAAGPRSIVAVEPVEGMRAELVAKSPAVRAVEGTAQSTGLDDASADLVTIAQAFHWFADDEAVAELARILRPGGFLALVWNTRDLSLPWQREIDVLMARLAGDAPRYRTENRSWQVPIASSDAFGPFSSARFENPVPGVDIATLRARVASTSYVSALPDDERERLLDDIEVRNRPSADDDGLFGERYLTDLFWCQRR